MAGLKVCSDQNWLSGKTTSDVEKLFMEESELGRTFIAEKLMQWFFPPPARFDKESGDLFASILTGKLKNSDIQKTVVAYSQDKTRLVFLSRLEPADIYETYSAALSPGLVLTADTKSHVNDMDVGFAPHRAASLGLVEFAGRQWLAFVLIEDHALPDEWLTRAGARGTGQRVRFLWLIGGGTKVFNDGDTLTEIVMAELWDGHSPARMLQTLEQRLDNLLSQALSLHPKTWIVNDVSWKAKLGGTVRQEIPDPVLMKQDFFALLDSLPGGEKRSRIAGPGASAEIQEAAMQELEKLLIQIPDGIDLHYAMGWTLNNLRRPDDALSHLQRVLALDPQHPLVLFDIGVSYTLKKDFNRAETQYRAALERYPEFDEPKLNLCGLYIYTEDVEKLKPTCAAAVEAAPENARLFNNLAWLFVTTENPALRDPAKGLGYAKKAVLLDGGKSLLFLDTLAEAYYANGQFDDAIETESKVASAEPQNSNYRERLQKYRRAKEDSKK
jgi:tetratricopeptide (TPR) repeat protein